MACLYGFKNCKVCSSAQKEIKVAGRSTPVPTRTQVRTLEDAIKDAGLEKPTMPGLSITIEFKLDGETIQDALDDSWGSDPVADIVNAIEDAGATIDTVSAYED